MASLSLTDVQLFADGVDLTGFTNQVNLEVSGDPLDVTTFGSAGWRSRIAGPGTAQVSASGYVQNTAGQDSEMFGDVAATSVVSIASTPTSGDTAFALQAVEGGYQWGGQYGDAAGFTIESASAGLVVPGGLLWPKADVTGAANGTGKQFAAGVAATESLYAAIHVLSAGTTCDVIVESDTTSGFSTPTTQISSTVTAAGGTWATAAGAITDTWFRVRFATVTGTFSIAVVVGIA